MHVLSQAWPVLCATQSLLKLALNHPARVLSVSDHWLVAREAEVMDAGPCQVVLWPNG